ncbi:Aste57867_17754 [Aphanomyces stellatus]|uniref:Aste57867_17754 protein n=1 Tax=Aphanomyces stellatus TaxID=120398 RepID=A0A485L8H2_9STRA|nr:hypothetical protein As57867_017693 [Aphanomyces stellatus]VFT94500.1 Aste57867_17754 [Aphanomyces stellatus]
MMQAASALSPPCIRCRPHLEAMAQKLLLVESENTHLLRQMEVLREKIRRDAAYVTAVQAEMSAHTKELTDDATRMERALGVIMQQEATIKDLLHRVDDIAPSRTCMTPPQPPTALFGTHLQTLLAKGGTSARTSLVKSTLGEDVQGPLSLTIGRPMPRPSASPPPPTAFVA